MKTIVLLRGLESCVLLHIKGTTPMDKNGFSL